MSDPDPEAQSEPEITQLLRAWAQGNGEALQEMVPLVHRELKRIAAGYMRHERPGHTLQVSALVNEAFLRLTKVSQTDWKDRAHFFALSSQLMRRILVDHARSRGYGKRGGGAFHTPLDAGLIAPHKGSELIALDDALKVLEQDEPRMTRMVELRFFGGLTVQETAEVLGVSEETVHRDWRFAKSWLARELSRS